MNTHGLVVGDGFGKFKGQKWTRVPTHFLKWVVNSGKGLNREIAKSELERRGSEVSTGIEITKHALDRASLRFLDKWMERENKDEGIYSWLVRMSTEALREVPEEGDNIFMYQGMRFVFKLGDMYPILLSVMKKH